MALCKRCNVSQAKRLLPSQVRSLNGCRVNEMILRLVPNVESFRTTLKAIKYWAKVFQALLGILALLSHSLLSKNRCEESIPTSWATLEALIGQFSWRGFANSTRTRLQAR